MLEEFGDNSLYEGISFDFSGNDVDTSTASENIQVDNYSTHEEIKTEEILEEPVKFIENPLPLPKKHVHREMDYGRVIPSAWMHYDVEIDTYDYKCMISYKKESKQKKLSFS